MPLVTDPPPADAAAELAALGAALDHQIPARSIDRNVLIAGASDVSGV